MPQALELFKNKQDTEQNRIFSFIRTWSVVVLGRRSPFLLPTMNNKKANKILWSQIQSMKSSLTFTKDNSKSIP